MVRFEGNARRYWDKDGRELMEGDTIMYPNGRLMVLYAFEDEHGIGLGTDATNPAWIEDGRAVECEYGIYPLTLEEQREVVKVDDRRKGRP